MNKLETLINTLENSEDDTELRTLVDSIDMLEAIYELEQATGREIGTDELFSIKTKKELVNLLKQIGFNFEEFGRHETP